MKSSFYMKPNISKQRSAEALIYSCFGLSDFLAKRSFGMFSYQNVLELQMYYAKVIPKYIPTILNIKLKYQYKSVICHLLFFEYIVHVIILHIKVHCRHLLGRCHEFNQHTTCVWPEM